MDEKWWAPGCKVWIWNTKRDGVRKVTVFTIKRWHGSPNDPPWYVAGRGDSAVYVWEDGRGRIYRTEADALNALAEFVASESSGLPEEIRAQEDLVTRLRSKLAMSRSVVAALKFKASKAYHRDMARKDAERGET